MARRNERWVECDRILVLLDGFVVPSRDLVSLSGLVMHDRRERVEGQGEAQLGQRFLALTGVVWIALRGAAAEAVAADTFVDFNDGLNAAVKKLRYALGDSAENPVFIETFPRRGYRFIAPVEEVEHTPAVEPRGPKSGPKAREAADMPRS